MIITYLADHPEYLPIVARWAHGKWGHRPPARTVEQTEAGFRTRLNRDHIPLTLIALEGEQPLGMASIFVQDMSIRPELTPWLAAVFVAPDQRGKGIGSALVQAIEAKAHELGVTRLYLFTPDKQSFYARLGWSPVEWAEYRTERVLIMQKALGKG
jgi:GNAT superfamily N-acetyltransferase